MIDSLWFRVLLVALAGAAGSLCRWGVSHLAQVLLGHRWPVGTLVVNVLGCFVFGLVIALLHERPADDSLRLWLLTGFAGAFTTFSTFVFDTHVLQHDHGWWWAMMNLALHLVLGGVGLLVGLSVGRMT